MVIHPERSTFNAACWASGTISTRANGTAVAVTDAGLRNRDPRRALPGWPLAATPDRHRRRIRGTPTTPTIGQPDDLDRSSSAVMRDTRATGPDRTMMPTCLVPATQFICPSG